ncbi:molecular chaperone [Volvox carteri f. nagariensis]|uniref:Molecular chaperone n=1 Tax=Volvox carteri f. nagariensis TaxID=3068 RepID=D8U140_VOLCA|nr:molecular chaperone [Volvox carteri f. nagariensis]EFJ46492.1 molecular chaperone [Volvox carteri f. nagariensis]|eukprot:XP_002952349.1 molecular chaperone [Volvox carteri f. nagariensis]
MAKASFERLAAQLGKLEDDEGAKASAKEETKPNLTAAQRILKAWEAKDYFSLLGLPEPEADELGRPVWSCTEVEVSKAYRKLSIAVHPDKNPGDEESRRAFEVLNQAHRMLKDPTAREDVLRGAADKARRRREQQEAAADLSTRMQLNAAKNERVRELRKAEGQGLQGHILEQMRKRQEEAKRRAEAAAKAAQARGRREACSDDDDNKGGGGGGAAGGERISNSTAGLSLTYDFAILQQQRQQLVNLLDARSQLRTAVAGHTLVWVMDFVILETEAYQLTWPVNRRHPSLLLGSDGGRVLLHGGSRQKLSLHHIDSSTLPLLNGNGAPPRPVGVLAAIYGSDTASGTPAEQWIMHNTLRAAHSPHTPGPGLPCTRLHFLDHDDLCAALNMWVHNTAESAPTHPDDLIQWWPGFERVLALSAARLNQQARMRQLIGAADDVAAQAQADRVLVEAEEGDASALPRRAHQKKRLGLERRLLQ